MKQFDLKAPLTINIYILKMSGIWPRYDDFSFKRFHDLYSIFCFIFIVVCHNLSQTINIYFIYDQLVTLTASIVVALTELMGMIKFIIFYKNIKTVYRLMEILDEDVFQPKSLTQQRLLQKSFDTWKQIYFIFSFSAVMTLFLWGFYPLMDGSYKIGNLPFTAWYPYDEQTTPFYELTYSYQILANYFIAFTNQNIDAFISALLMYIAAECKLVGDSLKNVDYHKIEDIFVNIVQHHQEILKFAQLTDQFISLMAFGQFATSVISICMTLFQLTVVKPLSAEFYTLVCCQCAVFTQVFVYCWYGNEVIVESEKICNFGYQTDWYNKSQTFKQDLLFFLMRARKAIRIRAVKFFDLSLPTFSAILRSSWSYFALLRNLNH